MPSEPGVDRIDLAATPVNDFADLFTFGYRYLEQVGRGGVRGHEHIAEGRAACEPDAVGLPFLNSVGRRGPELPMRRLTCAACVAHDLEMDLVVMKMTLAHVNLIIPCHFASMLSDVPMPPNYSNPLVLHCDHAQSRSSCGT
jgi:hypothetical protein